MHCQHLHCRNLIIIIIEQLMGQCKINYKNGISVLDLGGRDPGSDAVTLTGQLRRGTSKLPFQLANEIKVPPLLLA